MASSTSTTSSFAEQAKFPSVEVLALDNVNRVFRSDLFSTHNRIIGKNIRDPDVVSFSISPVISHRFVFLVGGFLKNHPSPHVFVLELLNKFSPPFIPAPPLLIPKYFPTLIVMGPKLFAFPFAIQYSRNISPSDSSIEVLDTSNSHWAWHPLAPIPILEQVLPPCHIDSPPFSYSIISYAALESPNESILFLCLGDNTTPSFPYNKGVVSLNYDYRCNIWSHIVSDYLPFHGEGKFCDDLCYGFPCGIESHDCGFLSCYQLVNPSFTSLPSSWIELVRYVIPYGPLDFYYPYRQSFSVIQKNRILMMRARATGMTDEEPHCLELDLIELVTKPKESSLGFGRVLIHQSHINDLGFKEIVGAYFPRGQDGINELALLNLGQ